MSEIGSAEWWRVQYAALEKERDAALSICAAVSACFGFTGPIDRLPDAAESVLDLGRKTLAEYQHAERERIAALADNAALVEHARTERQMLSMLYHRIKAMGLRNEAMADAVTTAERWMDAVPDTYEQPHPGAALLEEHRKALVRARNEGLEALEKDLMLRADVAAEYGHIKIAEVWRNAASAARAMKEPESD